MGKLTFIDTHCHLDGEEFADDLEAVVARAREAGVGAIGVPGIDQRSTETVMALCRRYPGYCYPMFGLHPEEVKADWETVLDTIRKASKQAQGEAPAVRPIAVGEVGLDFYWSREFEREQLLAFEAQVKWSVETGLPLMIHCRKAQNELVAILKRYHDQLPGGVFHCFTGNALEAKELFPLYGTCADARSAQRTRLCGPCAAQTGRGIRCRRGRSGSEDECELPKNIKYKRLTNRIWCKNITFAPA